jgi:2,3-bisphosphoglycerate-independent phosphoglycerate mutase
MKYAIVLPDGAADEPLAELDGRTILEVAKTPNMDWIASTGRQGVVVTVPEGFVPGSDVATLSVLGCDPRTCYSGRAPLEAAARDIPMGPRDIVFRCNLVTIADGTMRDFTAGHIAQTEAATLIRDLNRHFSGEPLEFFEGVQYRHLLVLRDVGEIPCVCTPPHDIPDQEITRHMPRGGGAGLVQEIMNRAAAFLENHEINVVRRDLGENPATHIWLWGQGRLQPLAPLTERFNLRGACIAAVDLIRGIARLNGLTLLEVDGATGFLDTNYAGKGASAAAALDEYDLVVVHVEAPDEAGHLGNVQEKRLAIERVDKHVVGPLLEKLKSFPAWRILVAPDHPTPVGKRVHTATPPPFCLAGSDLAGGKGLPFSESNAVQSGLRIDRGHELLEYFLRGQG